MTEQLLRCYTLYFLTWKVTVIHISAWLWLLTLSKTFKLFTVLKIFAKCRQKGTDKKKYNNSDDQYKLIHRHVLIVQFWLHRKAQAKSRLCFTQRVSSLLTLCPISGQHLIMSVEAASILSEQKSDLSFWSFLSKSYILWLTSWWSWGPARKKWAGFNEIWRNTERAFYRGSEGKFKQKHFRRRLIFNVCM